MQIIFGDHINSIGDTYTKLELDTFQSPTTGETMTAWCVVETIPLTEMPLAKNYQQIHADLIKAYQNRHWNYCKQAIEGLIGKWNGELDTFYTDLLERVLNFENSEPGPEWTGVIAKELPLLSTV